MESIILNTPAATWKKPVAGTMTYIMHQHEDLSWEIVRLKAGYPDDNESLKAILQSALDRLK